MTKRNAAVTFLCVGVLAALVSVVVVFASDANGRGRAAKILFTWECNTETELCEKLEYDSSQTQAPQLSFETCRIACGRTGRLWPAPRGRANLTTLVARVSPSKFELVLAAAGVGADVRALLTSAYDVFVGKVGALAGSGRVDDGYVGVDVTLRVQGGGPVLTYDTDESYVLTVAPQQSSDLAVTIEAPTFYGARHGLETLFQLIAYDEYCECFTMVSQAEIADSPAYKHRGLSLDTSRNYFPLSDLKRTVDAMAMNKLNILHWHMTDTHSFPFVSQLWPQMSAEGAYSPAEVYTMDGIRDFVEYARVRGVKVVPEFDAPAHCGNGWRWGQSQGLGDLVWCANEDPWYKLCVEPPCGQLNPLNENVFRILRDLYTEWGSLFDTDLVHLGGDELSEVCWTREPSIQQWLQANAAHIPDEQDKVAYLWWKAFEERAEQNLDAAYGNAAGTTSVILWTSGLTKRAAEYLDPRRHIVQVWTAVNSSEIGKLAREGFRLVMSNYDALYLDCGFHAWVGDGHNWCSPYKTWQQIHDLDPRTLIAAQVGEDFPGLDNLALGGEAALWTEQADTCAVDSRLWPRTAALAERLWSRPAAGSRTDKTLWRLQAQRNRMVQLGLKADALAPKYCDQNEGKCYRSDVAIVTDTGGE